MWWDCVPICWYAAIFFFFFFWRNLTESDSCLSAEGPLQVSLELRPLTTSSWTYIQGLSQNPRIRYLNRYIYLMWCLLINATFFRITVGASKRLVELLQMLSVRWKIDRATISIYHTYSIKNHADKYPEMGESHLNVTKHSNVLCSGEIIIVFVCTCKFNEALQCKLNPQCRCIK